MLLPVRPDRSGERQLRAELAHWRGAISTLADLDTVAAPAAWATLEAYLRLRVRERLERSVAELAAEGSAIAMALDMGQPLIRIRDMVLGLRRRYLEVETVLDFYGDAVNSRTNATLGAVLGGLDTLACDSMEVILRPLGFPVPPALVYVDKGMGAAILRAGVRLWGPGGPSPVAAIKLTRHNLGHPTSLFHETGHQVAAQTGWVPQLAAALRDAVGRRSTTLADLWSGWTSEIAADVHAFALAGWSPVPALATVVDGPTTAVHRVRIGDPHPPAWLRVMFNVELCRAAYGTGPWDDLASTWTDRHDPRDLVVCGCARGQRQPPGPSGLGRGLSHSSLRGVRRPSDHGAGGPPVGVAGRAGHAGPPGRTDAAHLGVPRSPATVAGARPPHPRPADGPHRSRCSDPTPARLAGHPGPAPATQRSLTTRERTHLMATRSSTPSSDDKTLPQILAALQSIADAVNRGSELIVDNADERSPSQAQSTTIVDYLVLRELVGRQFDGVRRTVDAIRIPGQVVIFEGPVPAAATKVAVFTRRSVAPDDNVDIVVDDPVIVDLQKKLRGTTRGSSGDPVIGFVLENVTDDQPIVRVELREAEDLAVALGPRLAPVA